MIRHRLLDARVQVGSSNPYMQMMTIESLKHDLTHCFCYERLVLVRYFPATTMTTCEIVCLCWLIADMSIDVSRSILLYRDNRSVMQFAKKIVFHEILKLTVISLVVINNLDPSRYFCSIGLVFMNWSVYRFRFLPNKLSMFILSNCEFDRDVSIINYLVPFVLHFYLEF